MTTFTRFLRAIGLLSIVCIGLVLFSGEPINLHFRPRATNVPVPQFVLLLIGMLLGGAAVFLLGHRSQWTSGPEETAIAAIAVLVLFGGIAGQIDFVRGAMLIIVGVATLLVLRQLVERMKAGESVEVQSHWGGLGGGLGGWRMSPAMVLLIVGIVLFGGALGLALKPVATGDETTEAAADVADASATEAKAEDGTDAASPTATGAEEPKGETPKPSPRSG